MPFPLGPLHQSQGCWEAPNGPVPGADAGANNTAAANMTAYAANTTISSNLNFGNMTTSVGTAG